MHLVETKAITESKRYWKLSSPITKKVFFEIKLKAYATFNSNVCEWNKGSYCTTLLWSNKFWQSFDNAIIISSDSVPFKPMRVTLRWRELTWCASVKKRFCDSISRLHAVLRIHSFFPCPCYAQCLYDTSVISSRKFGQMRSAFVTTVTGTPTLTHPHVWNNAGKALEKKWKWAF